LIEGRQGGTVGPHQLSRLEFCVIDALANIPAAANCLSFMVLLLLRASRYAAVSDSLELRALHAD